MLKLRHFEVHNFGSDRGIYAKPEELMDIEGDFYRATLICGKTSKL
jgi:hypothetical protein